MAPLAQKAYQVVIKPGDSAFQRGGRYNPSGPDSADMDVSDVVSTEFERVAAEDPVSSFRSRFADDGVDAVVVFDGDEYVGVVTPRELTRRGTDPDARARSVLRHVPRIAPDEGVREAARLLVAGGSRVLPAFDGDDLAGVVTAGALLEAVRPYLRVLTVGDVYTAEVVTVAPEDGLGEALHAMREVGGSHLPVVEDGAPVGMVALRDLLSFATREVARAQGGSPDAAGGRGGFGDRAGEIERLLDLPVENVMVEPVETTTRGERLDRAVGRMFDAGVSSLAVLEGAAPGGGDLVGIVTTTDALRSLTWTDEPGPPVQITGVDLMDDLTREEVAEAIEAIAGKYRRLRVLEANVAFHEHDETLRGLSLIRARIRLFTDRGHFVGHGEGFGAAHAFRLAANVVEREVLEGKDYARTKKPASGEELSKLLGWWLVGQPRRR